MLVGEHSWREFREVSPGTVQKYAGVVTKLLLTASRHHTLARQECLTVEHDLLPSLQPRLQQALTQLQDALQLWRQTAGRLVQLAAPFERSNTALYRLREEAVSKFKSDPAWARPLYHHVTAVLEALFCIEGDLDAGAYQFPTHR
jgi:hypothetical protein